jgi:hypothetical protein
MEIAAVVRRPRYMYFNGSFGVGKSQRTMNAKRGFSAVQDARLEDRYGHEIDPGNFHLQTTPPTLRDVSESQAYRSRARQRHGMGIHRARRNVDGLFFET